MPVRTTVEAGAATNVHTLESLKKLPRNKLQALTKKLDYQANAKSVDIIEYVLRASGSPAPAPAPLPPLWSPGSLPAGPNGKMLDANEYRSMFDDRRVNGLHDLGYTSITLLSHWECEYKPAFAAFATIGKGAIAVAAAVPTTAAAKAASAVGDVIMFDSSSGVSAPRLKCGGAAPRSQFAVDARATAAAAGCIDVLAQDAAGGEIEAARRVGPIGRRVGTSNGELDPNKVRSEVSELIRFYLEIQTRKSSLLRIHPLFSGDTDEVDNNSFFV